MEADKCMNTSFRPDPLFVPGGGQWGSSADQFMAVEAEALARALGAAVNPGRPAAGMDVTPSSPSRSSHFFPCSPSTTGSASTFTVATPHSSSSSGSSFLSSRPGSASGVPRPIPPARPQPSTGRVSKRKPRRAPSRRAEVSYIEADPAVFREMVQRMTGHHMEVTRMPAHHQQPMPVVPNHQSQQQFLLPPAMPTLDISAGFVDTVPVPTQNQQLLVPSTPGGFDDSLSFYLSDFDDLLTTAFPEIPQQQQQHQQLQSEQLLPLCFPTLESWSD